MIEQFRHVRRVSLWMEISKRFLVGRNRLVDELHRGRTAIVPRSLPDRDRPIKTNRSLPGSNLIPHEREPSISFMHGITWSNDIIKLPLIQLFLLRAHDWKLDVSKLLYSWFPRFFVGLSCSSRKRVATITKAATYKFVPQYSHIPLEKCFSISNKYSHINITVTLNLPSS